MKRLKIYPGLIIPFLAILFFSSPAKLYSQEYLITESYFIDDICNSDIDLDGDNDLIICSSSNDLPDTLFIFYNDGFGNLDNTSLCRQNGIFVLCGNVDNDEFPDIITKGGGNILFIKNNGDGSFGEEIPIAPSEGSRVIEYIMDMDVDGFNDLVYTYNGYYCKWGILRNEGNLIFTDHIIYSDNTGTNLSPIIGTLNSDNLPDACFEYTSEGIHLLINNGDLTFDSLLFSSTKGYTAICDLDLNPPQDILLFAPTNDQLIFYENLGNSMFEDRNTVPLINGLAPFVADLNNDGYDDLAYVICFWTGYTDSIYIRLNDQNWNFHKPQQYYVGPMEMFKTEITDLNGDNFNDIIMYGYSPRNAFKILWNDGFGGFSYENPVGISETTDQSERICISVSPNPFSSICRITVKPSIHEGFQISITDLFSQSVKQFNISSIYHQEIFEMNWDGKDNEGNELAPGVYFLTVTDNKHQSDAIKIIKY